MVTVKGKVVIEGMGPEAEMEFTAKVDGKDVLVVFDDVVSAAVKRLKKLKKLTEAI